MSWMSKQLIALILLLSSVQYCDSKPAEVDKHKPHGNIIGTNQATWTVANIRMKRNAVVVGLLAPLLDPVLQNVGLNGIGGLNRKEPEPEPEPTHLWLIVLLIVLLIVCLLVAICICCLKFQSCNFHCNGDADGHHPRQAASGLEHRDTSPPVPSSDERSEKNKESQPAVWTVEEKFTGQS